MGYDDNDVREIVSAEAGTVAILNASEIDRQIATAHKYPRSVKRFRATATDLVTLDDATAEECIYALPRTEKDPETGQKVKKTIEGPSARFAEIMAHSWGNCRAGARVVDENGDFVVAQGVFHDLEANVAITYEVRRKIVNKHGHRFSADMIGVTANAACSIALRNAVLKGVPKAIWGPCYEAARQVVMGDAETLANRRSAAFAYLQKFGATPDMVYSFLGVAGMEDVTLEHLVLLRGIATAIKEGETTVERAFADPDDQPDAKTSAVSDRVRKAKEQPKAAPAEAEPAQAAQPAAPAEATAKEASAASEQPAAAAQAEAPASANTKDYSFEELIEFVEEAETAATVNWIEGLPSKHLSPTQARSVKRAIAAKREVLAGGAA